MLCLTPEPPTLRRGEWKPPTLRSAPGLLPEAFFLPLPKRPLGRAYARKKKKTLGVTSRWCLQKRELRCEYEVLKEISWWASKGCNQRERAEGSQPFNSTLRVFQGQKEEGKPKGSKALQTIDTLYMTSYCYNNIAGTYCAFQIELYGWKMLIYISE